MSVLSQGHHPFAYALAELIDNALRATRQALHPNQSRRITISFVTKGSGSNLKGLICVQDNGSGMTKQALNDWAIMNLSMEDKGLKTEEPEPAARGQATAAGAANFLTGELSHFGVLSYHCKWCKHALHRDLSASGLSAAATLQLVTFSYAAALWCDLSRYHDGTHTA